jgi:hypothetical protein
MVPLVLFTTGVGLLGLPALTARWARHLPPAEWSRVCGVLLLAGAGIVESAAVLAGLPIALQALGEPGLAHLCHLALPDFPGSGVVSWLSLAMAAGIPASAVSGARRARQAGRAAQVIRGAGISSKWGPYELVVLPLSRLIAVSVAGAPGRIVISDGLIQALSPEQLSLVVRHESAHLELKHQRWLTVAAGLDRSVGLVGPLRKSTATWRRSLERCADEIAAGADLDRRQLLRSALLDLSIGTAGPAVAAFGAADTVLERTDALLEPPPAASWRVRALVYGPAGWGIGIASAAVLAWVTETGLVLALAGRCPA